MNRVVVLVVLAVSRVAFAQPMLHRHINMWIAAHDAAAEIDACTKPAGSAFGDVVVEASWKASASKSLGADGPAIATCVRDVIKKHYKRETRPGTPETYTLKIGTATDVLPPPATFMPLWRAALAPHATAADRAAFAALVPPDYKIVKQCLQTDREYARAVQDHWLEGLTPIPEHSASQLVAHQYAGDGRWDGVGIVTRSMDGICADAFDPVAARKVFDREGSCFGGSPTDILLAPHIEFPPATYTQVTTRGGRTCVLTSTGAVTCCGRIDENKPLTAPKTAFKQIGLGDDFACGLDAAGLATCWGRVTTAPKTAFTKLAVGHYEACGIRADGGVECWPDAKSPTGTFIDIALDWGMCGVRTNGTIDCWDRAPTANPASRWLTLAIGNSQMCGLRLDQSVGCTQDHRTDLGKPMSTVVPQKWTQIALAEKFGACGIQTDGTIGCSDLQPGLLKPRGTPPPSGTFTHIAASESQFCAVGSAGTIACWGEAWPEKPRRVRAPEPADYRGTIVDEAGAPIANATVSIDERAVPRVIATTGRDGTWSAAMTETTMWANFTAPGREVVSLYGDRIDFGRPIVLRPAATVEIDATCDGQPCSSMVQLGLYLHAPKLEHLAPGSYRALVWTGHGADDERLAHLEIEMPFAARPQLLHVATKPTGTGHAIHGTTSTTTGKSLANQHVELTCANHTLRLALTDATGKFELRNVPPPPCELKISGLELNGWIRHVDSFADVAVELR